MQTLDIPNQLALYIEQLAKGEAATERVRQALAQEKVFDAATAFSKLDFKLKGYLTARDLVRFLRYPSLATIP